MSPDGRRPKRVADAIREILADALTREVSDPRLMALVITDVQVTDDLGVARVCVRLLAGDDDPALRRQVIRALEHAGPRLRRLVAPRLRLRRSPELRFEYDAGHDAERRVAALLHEIAKEPRAKDD
jgi:ribosome-binding factor A